MKRWARARFTPNLPLRTDGQRVTASAEHIRLSKEAAREGMVLLKNDAQVLPLSVGAKVALFGKGTFDYVKGGGGSGDVTVPYIRNIYDGFMSLADRTAVYPGTIDFYKDYVAGEYAKGLQPGMIREPDVPAEMLQKAAAWTDTAVISISRFSGEGWDRKSEFDRIEHHKGVDQNFLDMANSVYDRGDFYLSSAEQEMVDQVSAAFRKVIIVLNVGGMMDTSWFKDNDRISSVLLAWQGGMEGGTAAAELLCGIANPSGKLADTLAKRLEDYPGAENFFESDAYVEYIEDVYVGYRYFETIPGAAEKVVYPFGYGLSYTTFEVEAPKVSICGDEITVKVFVTNTGSYAGREVIQVYYSAPQGKLGKPAKELAGYRKTNLLRPGESQNVVIRFDAADMASYDDLGKVAKAAWVLEKGSYVIYAGTSVRAVQAADIAFEVAEDRIVKQLTTQLAPTQLSKRMLSDGSYEELPMSEPYDTDANVLERMDFTKPNAYAPAVRYVAPQLFFAQDPNRIYLEQVAEGTASMEAFLAQLSDDDLCWIVGGQPNTGVANTFGYGNLPEYGVPNITTADGPAGLRIHPGLGVETTAFPCSTLVACTWDPAVAESIGRAGGAEVKENNIGAWLTPAINIHRIPLCGRNFEYYSEDPLLCGKQAAAMVRGIQSNRVAATAKHFALNNKETNRVDSDSRASERAIREIYLKAFQILVEEADPWSIMTSYNIINGQRSSESKELLTEILRKEWGYTGMVTTDWWNWAENYKEVAAGNDIKMGCGYPERVKEALLKGAVTREELELAASHILGLILKID